MIFKNLIYGKIQLTTPISFISSNDHEKESVMHSRNKNIIFMSFNDANEVVNELFDSLCSRYQRNIETSMQGNVFIFDSIQIMYYKCHKLNFRRGCSYIDSPDLIKKTNNKSRK